MGLLEREDFLGSLAEYADAARGGESRLVLVTGEAGVGKTTLLEALRGWLPDARWLWGGCDGSFTPQPLGPLFDIAEQVGGPLAEACHTDAPRQRMFQLLLDELTQSPVLTVVAVEDVHWADESTLDLLRFLGRRLRDARTLLLVTYRDDGLTPDHPLRKALGELTTQRSARRISLPPLSRQAVDSLARGTGVEAEDLFRLTGGNPFFVTQVLDSGNGTVPLSAGDAVLARIARLPADARRVVEAAAVIGTRVELALLRRVAGQDTDAIDGCLTTGLLASDSDGFRFRHEIARMAVEDDLPAHRRTDLHRLVLEALQGSAVRDDARLAHHAEGAGDGEAVLRHAPAAARRAAELAAHREAAAQYERALRFADALSPAERAALHDGLAAENAVVDRWEQAAEAWQQALELWQEAGDQLRVGNTLRLLSKAEWRLCRGAEAGASAARALEVLESVPPSRELAWAYANLAGVRMLHGDDDAVPLARRAQALAEGFGDDALLSEALNTEGAAQISTGGDGEPQLRRALEVALAAGLMEQVGRAYTNLQVLLSTAHRFGAAEQVFLDGLAYCEEKDLGTFASCLQGVHTYTLGSLGKWTEAVALADRLLARRELSPVNRLNTLLAVSEVLVRRGDPQAWLRLDELTTLAEGNGEAQCIGPLRVIRLEAAWLAGDVDEAVREARLALVHADRCDAWLQGALLVWLRRCGVADVELPLAAEPYARQLAGDWAGAAAMWHTFGCPYDEALALMDSGEETALREAAALFDGLGAAPAVAATQAALRRLGVRAIPRGPRSATRADRFGLTPREREVLALLSDGSTNAEIAARLVISEKTVGHHVSAVLAKMGVGSRRAASRLAADSLVGDGAT